MRDRAQHSRPLSPRMIKNRALSLENFSPPPTPSLSMPHTASRKIDDVCLAPRRPGHVGSHRFVAPTTAREVAI